ncbi:MAG: hypothetical protein GOVbin1782_122 [Prokaryotic dsDNA virus sp.]|nr:MAG: hypothetical protein GOVbin1782_122 [Prokaryotic dsDNA virus sp.]
MVIMKDRAQKIWLLTVDALTIIVLLVWNVSIIVVLGVALIPALIWRFLFGTKREITRYTKEGLKIEGQDTSEDKQEELEVS